MSTFRYKIAIPGGQVKEKTVIADSMVSLRRKLESEGNFVLDISRAGGDRLLGSRLRLGKQISHKEFFSFNQEFGVLLKAGLSVVAALGAIIEKNEESELRNLLLEIRQDITAGESLSGAFDKFSHLFSKLYIMSLKAGEKSGDIPTTIARYLAYMKKSAELKRKVIAAAIYPIILMVVSISVLFFLMIYVVPTIAGTFLESGNKLPEMTNLLIAVSTFFRDHFVAMIAVAGCLWLAGVCARRTVSGGLFFDQLKLRMGFLGTLYRNYITSMFCRTLSTLLSAGIPLLDAVQIASGTIRNQAITSQLAEVVKQIAEGGGFSESLRRIDTFPKLAVRMIGAGETGGALPQILSDVADFYDGDVDAKLAVLTSAIEPMLMVFMGLVIGLIVLALYLPIFQMAGTI
ncbi:MAG: type II secretion system F family protein [Thermodesulfobacteriota bacterium]